MARITSGVVVMFTAALLGIALVSFWRQARKNYLRNKAFLLVTCVFVLIVQPIFFNISAYAKSVIIAPNLRKLIATRLHRWTLGHSN